MACCCYILYKSPFVFKSVLKLGQIGVWLPTPPHVPISHTTNFGIWSGPPPTFWDNVLKSYFFFFEGIPYQSYKHQVYTNRYISRDSSIETKDDKLEFISGIKSANTYQTSLFESNCVQSIFPNTQLNYIVCWSFNLFICVLELLTGRTFVNLSNMTN